MKRLAVLFGIIFALSMSFCVGLLVGLRYERYELKNVIDGDTFWVVSKRDRSEWKVRLWSVDAPAKQDCYGEESSALLEKYLKEGSLAFEKKGYDGFGRVLSKVYVNGKDLQEMMIATGAAVVYDAFDVHDDLKPSKEEIERLRVFEKEAKEKGLGVWSSGCIK